MILPRLLEILGWTILICNLLPVYIHATEDLYAVLGVARTATKREIKQAYRRKALDTHPDKNKDVPAEDAAEAFRKVVHAFEILSDDGSRQRYDRTGRSDSPQQQQQQGSSWTFRWSSSSSHRWTRPKLKDRFDVKEAQSRLLHIVSLEQLETVIVNEEGTLERNLLICFCPVPLETHVMDEMVYPYPFAAMSPQGIWWEDMLQTTLVRFHRTNDLTEFFGIPSGDRLKEPIFVFGKRLQKFGESSTWHRIGTKSRGQLEAWVWNQLQVVIEFVNQHDHPIEVLWVHAMKGSLKMTIQPGGREKHTSMLSHEWWVRDARTDTRKDSPGRWKLSDNTILKKWKIVSDKKREYIIPQRKCYDLSGHCGYWMQTRQCTENPVFMADVCKLTCGFCESDYREDDDDVEEENSKSDYDSKNRDSTDERDEL